MGYWTLRLEWVQLPLSGSFTPVALVAPVMFVTADVAR